MEQGTAKCFLQDPPKPITVGDLLYLNCQGDFKNRFKESLNIVLKEADYSLVLLEVLELKSKEFELLVTSYRTGLFNKSFEITDGEQSVAVKDLSFTVQSVLTDKDQRPLPPFGPFSPSPDFFWLFLFLSSFFCALSVISLFFYRVFKRRKFVSRVKQRQKSLSPEKNFILHLRKEPQNNKIAYLEKHFRFFLEDCFLIPANNIKDLWLIKQLKHFYPRLNEKHLRGILYLLQEFSHYNQNKNSETEKQYFVLKKLCKNLVFALAEDPTWKN